jgi:DNA-binding SARP family transcriptional activator/TolB-like protein
MLLKLLAMQPRCRLHREKLIEFLWPDQDIVSATRNLHRALHIARRALEPQLSAGESSQFIVTQGQQIILQGNNLHIDVIEFEQRASQALKTRDLTDCQDALSLYEGDLLPEDLSEDWSTVRREQLRAIYREILLCVSQLLEKSGDYQNSIERLKTLLDFEPADEEAHRRLMRTYALTGDRHLAVQQYRQCAELLRRQLEAEPDELTAMLYEQIISGKIRPIAASASAMSQELSSLEKAADDLRLPAEPAPSQPVTFATEKTLRPSAPTMKVISASPAELAQPLHASAASAPAQVYASSVTGGKLWSFRRAGWIGLLCLLLMSSLAAGFYFVLTRDHAIDSLAILPLVNDGADPHTEYLSEGLTESLINSLSSVPNLRVAARSTVFRYRNENVDAQEAGRQLGVRAVLTGRVTQQGDLLTVRTELVDTNDGARIWAETYQRRFSDLVALQTELSWEISDKLKLRLEGEAKERVTRRFTSNAAAYQLYLRGRYYWNRRSSDGLRKAVEYYEQAIRQDPAYALAHVGLADAYAVWPDDSLPRRKTAEAAKASAARALQLDDRLPEAHTSLAFAQMLLDRDLASAEKLFQRILTFHPDYATAHHRYAYNLLALNHLPAAVTAIRRAQELDPASLSINNDVGEILYFTRQYDQAVIQSRKTLALDADFIPAHQTLGLALMQKGRHQEGIAELRQALNMSGGNAYIHSLLGYAYAVAGRRDEAEFILSELQKSASSKYISPYHLAITHAALGNQEQALTLLEEADDEKVFSFLLLKVDPRLDRLRDHPRFASLLRRIRFQ